MGDINSSLGKMARDIATIFKRLDNMASIEVAKGATVITDHGQLTGLLDDDHTQYLNTLRHDLTERHALGTVVPHDSHSNLTDLTLDTHSQYLNNTRHDTTTRHTLGTVVPHDDHGLLSGLADDDHSQYLNLLRHDTTDRHALGTVVPHDDHGLLSGLGDDDHTQYASANGSGTRSAYQAERANKSVIAGNGLTGGGILTSDVTLNIGAGDGILVVTDAIAVDVTHDFIWVGKHEFQSAITSCSIVPSITDNYDLGSSTALWRKGWLSELDAVVFAKNTASVIGGWLIVPKGEGTFSSDVTDTQTTINFGQAMTDGHFVLLRAGGAVEYILVGSLVSGTTYNVTRNVDGTGANSWPAGSVYLILGTVGDGRVEINSYDSPRISVMVQGVEYNDCNETIRIGDLANWQESSLTGYGIAIGDYSTNKYMYYESDDGLVVSGDIKATSGSFEGFLNIGTSGGIYQGTYQVGHDGDPTYPDTGIKLFNSSGIGSLVTYSAGDTQIEIDSTGSLKAGAGNVILNASGISLISGLVYDLTRSITFQNSDNEITVSLFSNFSADSNSANCYLKSDQRSFVDRSAVIVLETYANEGLGTQSLVNIKAAYDPYGDVVEKSAELSLSGDGSAGSLAYLKSDDVILIEAPDITLNGDVDITGAVDHLNIGIGTGALSNTIRMGLSATLMASTASNYFRILDNAKHDGANWVRLTATNAASMIEMNSAGAITVYRATDAGNTIGSTITWGISGYFDANGTLNVGGIKMSGTKYVTANGVDYAGLIYVPMPSYSELYNNATLAVGNYDIDANSYSVPVGAKAIFVNMMGLWSAANSGYYVSVTTKSGHTGGTVNIRGLVANHYIMASGIRDLDADGCFAISVGGAQVTNFLFRIHGYFI